MKITIKTIPHEAHRYPTVGDYYGNKDNLTIAISNMVDSRYILLVAVHELVEWALCTDKGIPISIIDAFDIKFELAGKEGEPGDDPEAPYHTEHVFATKIERMFAEALGVNWDEYEETLEKLFDANPADN